MERQVRHERVPGHSVRHTTHEHQRELLGPNSLGGGPFGSSRHSGHLASPCRRRTVPQLAHLLGRVAHEERGDHGERRRDTGHHQPARTPVISLDDEDVDGRHEAADEPAEGKDDPDGERPPFQEPVLRERLVRNDGGEPNPDTAQDREPDVAIERRRRPAQIHHPGRRRQESDCHRRPDPEPDQGHADENADALIESVEESEDAADLTPVDTDVLGHRQHEDAPAVVQRRHAKVVADPRDGDDHPTVEELHGVQAKRLPIIRGSRQDFPRQPLVTHGGLVGEDGSHGRHLHQVVTL